MLLQYWMFIYSGLIFDDIIIYILGNKTDKKGKLTMIY